MTNKNLSQNDDVVNMGKDSNIAVLKNVGICMRALEMAMGRQNYLPGLVCFYGPSGWGKSFSAAYCAQKFNAYYIECKSTWTKRAILENILKEMGLNTEGQIYKMAERISEQLAISQRPLIIDEVDHIVKKAAIEIIRDIYEGSGGAILLIGEEHLPSKLKKWERFFSRILEFAPAQPGDKMDCKKLMPFYAKDLEIKEDLIEAITNQSKGSIRKMAVNLARIREFAVPRSMRSVGLTDWGLQNFYTGEAPARRVF